VPFTVWLGCATLVIWLGLTDDNHRSVIGIVDSQRASIITPSRGRITAITASLHQTVEQGQVIAQLDDTAIRLRLTKTNQELDILRAEIEKEQADIAAETGRLENKLELDATIERRRLITNVESARLTALATRAEIEEVRIRAQGAAIESDRTASLTTQGYASPAELIRLRTLKDALNKRLTELEKLHAQQNARTTMFTVQLADFQPLASAPAGVEKLLTPLRLKLQRQSTELEEIEHLRNQLLLRAPISGQVTEIALTEGEWASSGQTVATIVASKPNSIVAYVAAPQSEWLQNASKLEVQTASRIRIGETVIRSISPTTVRMPSRLWSDPKLPEWAIAVVLAPTELTRPGELVHIVHSNTP
jgi:HlyD family secretion protein